MPDFLQHPDTSFPVGVEYYRAPVPRADVWEADFARIRAAGLRIVRSFSFWNWMEPAPGRYELDDFDRLFDLAEKHELFVWLDITLATHGACPEWLTRQYPDLRAVDHRDQPCTPHAGAAAPQGSMIHCYDHPAWRRWGGDLLRHVVERYKDRPNLLIWGLWDGVSPVNTGAGDMHCYCSHTLARYREWLRERFSLDDLNQRFLRRYRSWEDVDPPRSNHNIVEMLMYRRFHRDNLVDQLDWMVAEARSIDPFHEMRAHAASTPRPWDQVCASRVDSWGMSMSSNHTLTADDASALADRTFSFDLSRSLGSAGRWWNEEIYAGMSRGGVTWKKQSDPRELTALLWLSLAGGAAGVMFWQYRPEYLSFESPGYNLVALDGEPTPRLEAVTRAIAHIDGMADHLPLTCPRADVGIVYHPESQELFGLNDETARFNADLRGVYRTLWRQGVPVDVITDRVDWSRYRLLFLPNVALMTDEMRRRIETTLQQTTTRLVAEGNFGLYASDGQSSYGPPEGLGGRLGVRVADFSAVTPRDIEGGRNTLCSPYGHFSVTTPCGYAVLEPSGDTHPIATLENETVAVRSVDGRFTWFGLTLSAGFGDVACVDMAMGLVREAGVEAPVGLDADGLVPVVRRSRQGGWLIFLLNLERSPVRTALCPGWESPRLHDLIEGREVTAKAEGSFEIEVGPWEVGVFYSEE